MSALALDRPMRPLPFGLLYYPGTRCPFCSSHSFHVGRVTAECVGCTHALIIADARSISPSKED